MNLFYSPIVTYLPLLITLVISNYMIALKLFAALCIIASGITMYHFTYQITKNRIIALFAGFFYMIAPYKLSNIYKRFAIGEFTAMVFTPLVFLGLYNLFNQDGKKHYYIAIGTIGLVLSHTVSTLYTAIFCALYIFFYISKLKNKEIIKKCLINIIFILLVSAFFLVPFIEATSHAEYAIMNNEVMSTNSNYTWEKTISFKDFFIDSKIENRIVFLIGLPTIIATILSVFVFKKVNKEYKELYLVTFIFSLISLVMCTKLFPWLIMPNILCKLQYPWRMLGFFNFFISFVCGINLYLAINSITKKDSIKVLITLIFVIFSVTNSVNIMSRFYTKDEMTDIKYQERILSNKKISCKIINREYMPIKALYLQNTYIKDRKDETYVLQGNAEIVEENKENLTDIIKVKNISKDTILEFPYYYYVGYKITMIKEDGTTKEIEPIESKNGFIAYIAKEDIEEATIKIEYVGTTVTYVSYIVSAISLTMLICYIIYENRKNVKYIKA